ncbi:MAG: hypothetical protein L0Y36_00870 [Planctomycetales bacterium]|nr:hypothetical protein [Planctomycetales bacterium]
MKEIDFIPEWYRADRKRKQRYVRQCVRVSIVLALMMLWSFIAGRHVERLHAEVTGIQTAFERGRVRIEQAQELEQQIAAMREKARMLTAIAPRTPVSSLMGEVSCLVGNNLILSRLSFQNEPLREDCPQGTSPSAAVVQAAASGKQRPAAIPSVPSRMKVVLTGIAAAPADAASLILALEQTDYFEQVAPVFTRAKKVKDADVTEFEIRCYVADYRIEK